MQKSEIVKVNLNIETICCDGGQDSLGHPAVYYTFDNQNKIVCDYCGKTYIRDLIAKKDNKNV